VDDAKATVADFEAYQRPDELAWIARLAERFGVELSPHAALVFEEVSERCFGGIGYAEIGERAALPPAAERATAPAVFSTPSVESTQAGSGLRLVAYTPLFSGPEVERTPELAFQRPEPVVQVARADARTRGIRNGAVVTVSSNGTSVAFRARIAGDVPEGTVRIAREHAGELQGIVEVRA
jgi:hypothetical protein